MTWSVVALCLLVALIVLSATLMLRDRYRQRRAYANTVGLTLEELVELLPAHLQDRRYTRYVLAPWNDEYLSVGLVYDDDTPRCGNPPNIGLDFDRTNGTLVRIHEEGIGLGVK